MRPPNSENMAAMIPAGEGSPGTGSMACKSACSMSEQRIRTGSSLVPPLAPSNVKPYTRM